MRRLLAPVLALIVAGCLPGDTRPPPGKLYTTVQAASSSTEGFVTSDGWAITFDRLLMGLGRIDPEGSDCNVYGEARYSRLYDFKLPGTQKVSEVYALGRCDVGLRIGRVADDDPLGTGVSEADRAFMREGGLDPFVEETTGASAYVRGSATKGDVTKRFEWTFRISWSLTNCPVAADSDAGMATLINLIGEQTVVLPLEVRAEELFRERADETSPITFGRLASTDADDNGVITLDELAALPAPAEPDAGMKDAAVPEAGKPDVMDTFEGYLYTTLVPRMVRVLGGGACAADLSPGGGGHHGPPI